MIVSLYDNIQNNNSFINKYKIILKANKIKF